MSEPRDRSKWQTSARGERGWKEDTERIAARNSEARRAGKQRRKAREGRRDERRRAVAANERAALSRDR